MNKPKICYPGSFDPIHLGHTNIVERLCKNYDVTIVIAKNEKKSNMFTAEERRSLWLDCIKFMPIPYPIQVAICPDDVLLVEFLKERDIHIIARGARNDYDFIAEMDLATHNLIQSNNEIETALFFTSAEYSHISSSAVKTLASFANGDISKMVPTIVHKAVYSRIKK
jgi:pantetheine-phosphate adenylyltransferase